MGTFFQLVGGILLLYAGAELLVRGGSALALRVGVSPLVVGLTIISFGTSSPEWVVSFGAALRGDSAIALGNVMGSNIANIALVLGLCALIRPIRVERQVVRREFPIMAVASLLLCGMLLNGNVGRIEGAFLFVGLIGFIAFSFRTSRSGEEEPQPKNPARKASTLAGACLAVLGLALLLPGAHLFVAGAVTVAVRWEISSFVIGLTLVAVGTSLPELATALVAAARGKGDLVLGTVVGSNIFNILGILGLTALVFGVDGGGISRLDLGMMIAVTLVSLPIMRTGFVVSRWEGLFLLGSYGVYLYYRVVVGG